MLCIKVRVRCNRRCLGSKLFNAGRLIRNRSDVRAFYQVPPGTTSLGSVGVCQVILITHSITITREKQTILQDSCGIGLVLYKLLHFSECIIVNHFTSYESFSLSLPYSSPLGQGSLPGRLDPSTGRRQIIPAARLREPAVCAVLIFCLRVCYMKLEDRLCQRQTPPPFTPIAYLAT